MGITEEKKNIIFLICFPAGGLSNFLARDTITTRDVDTCVRSSGEAGGLSCSSIIVSGDVTTGRLFETTVSL